MKSATNASRPAMTIKIPAALAARLRHRLAELEIPVSLLRRDVWEYLENTLEDDGLLLGAWVYNDRAAAERVARRVFARRAGVGVRCCEMMYGKDERTVEFFNPERKDDETAGDHASWLRFIRARVRRLPGRSSILPPAKALRESGKEVAA